jgi:hypothetical protein
MSSGQFQLRLTRRRALEDFQKSMLEFESEASAMVHHARLEAIHLPKSVPQSRSGRAARIVLV